MRRPSTALPNVIGRDVAPKWMGAAGLKAIITPEDAKDDPPVSVNVLAATAPAVGRTPHCHSCAVSAPDVEMKVAATFAQVIVSDTANVPHVPASS